MSKMIVPTYTYKLMDSGVRRSDGACIPEAESNRDWKMYQEWLAEGNTPEPQYTEQELIDKAQSEEIGQLRDELRNVVTGQFEMMLELFKLLKQFTDCTNADVDPAILEKAQAWTQKLARLKEIS